MFDFAWMAIENALRYNGIGKAIPVEGKEDDEEIWANSTTEVVLGSKSSWTFGLGTTNNTFGPRIDFNVDYSYVLKNLGKGKWKGYFSPLVVGATGYFSYNFGPETNISYGASDLSLQRKVHADQEFEIIQEGTNSLYPKTILQINAITTFLMVAVIAVVRFNHFLGFINDKTLGSVENTNALMNDVVNFVQPRFLAVLAKMELAYHAKAKLKELLAELKNSVSYMSDQAQSAITENMNTVQTVMNKLNWNEKILSDLQTSKSSVEAEIKKVEDLIKQNIRFVANVVEDSFLQNGRDNWYETNMAYKTMCSDYTLIANGKEQPLVLGKTMLPGSISLATQHYDKDAQKIEKQSGFLIKPENFKMKVQDDGKEFSSFDLGENGIKLVGKHDKGVIIQTKDQANAICQLHLIGKAIDMQCGDPKTSPSLKMDGDNNEFTLSVFTDTVGRSIRISKDSISIGHTSDPQQVAKLPQIEITPAGINLTAGLSSISIGFADIEFKVGENKQKIDPISISEIAVMAKQQADMLAEINNIIEKQKTQATALDQIQLKLQKS